MKSGLNIMPLVFEKRLSKESKTIMAAKIVGIETNMGFLYPLENVCMGLLKQ